MALVCSNPPMALHPLKVKVDLLYRPVRTYVHSFTDLLWFSLSLSLFEPPDPPAALQTHLTWTRPLYWLFSSCNALSPGIYMNRFLNVFRSLLKCHFLRRLPWVSFKNFVTLFYLHSPFPFFFFFFCILHNNYEYMTSINFIYFIYCPYISFKYKLPEGRNLCCFVHRYITEPRPFPGTWQALSKCLLSLLEQCTCLRW